AVTHGADLYVEHRSNAGSSHVAGVHWPAGPRPRSVSRGLLRYFLLLERRFHTEHRHAGPSAHHDHHKCWRLCRIVRLSRGLYAVSDALSQSPNESPHPADALRYSHTVGR